MAAGTGSTVQVDAGSFGEWLADMRAVLRGERDADVPCGDCVGCCVSSYPIPLRPGDELARERVPEQWLIGPARPGERWLMGFREDGSCPFMEGTGCSIYAGRPQTCRDYDCRIYAAAGLLPDGDRPVIQRRVVAWRFTMESPVEQAAADALQCAARFVMAHAAQFPAAMRAHSATAAAVLALKSYELFLDREKATDTPEPVQQAVQRVIEAVRVFDRGSGA